MLLYGLGNGETGQGDRWDSAKPGPLSFEKGLAGAVPEVLTTRTSEVCCSSLLHNHLRLRLAKYMRYSKSQNR